ncbi:MAG TPA: hypothetical protein VFU19_15445 [Iamia sp.]|nr:hypothetical protein [Iamia sp.]
MPELPEDRLRARLARYATALDDAAETPAPRPRHLTVVDTPAEGAAAGGPARDRRRRGPGVRVAAALLAVGLVGGTAWAATRPVVPSTTATTERGWADDDVVRPEDRPSAFAALDGTWPLPAGGSLRFVIDRPTDASTTFAAFRRRLAHTASCLWLRHALEEPDLGAGERATIATIPGWPGRREAAVPVADRRALQGAVDAALAGDRDRLRAHLVESCAGTATGLGLPEVGGAWLRPADGTPADAPPVVADGPAVAVAPAAIGGWAAIAERLGPDVTVAGAVRLPDGGYHVALGLPGAVRLSLTIATVDGPVALPVAEDIFAAGHAVGPDGVEVYAGPVGDDATVAHVVGPRGRALILSADAGPDQLAPLLGDLAALALDLHTAAWPR